MSVFLPSNIVSKKGKPGSLRASYSSIGTVCSHLEYFKHSVDELHIYSYVVNHVCSIGWAFSVNIIMCGPLQEDDVDCKKQHRRQQF